MLVRPNVAAFAALLFAFTSPLFRGSTSVAHYSHVYVTVSVSVLVYVSLRIVLHGHRRLGDVTILQVIILDRTLRLPYG